MVHNIFLVILVILAIESGLSFDTNNNRVDLIENGWIELVSSFTSVVTSNRSTSPRESLNFVAKCNRNYMLNSNSSQVLPVESEEGNNDWIPLNGYLIPRMPRLCIRVCVFQSSLSNGFIQIRASLSSEKNNTIQVHANSKVAFRCFQGYQLRTVSYKLYAGTDESYDVKSTVHKVTAIMEKCGREGVESKHLISGYDESEKSFHQCFKYCSLFQTDFSGMNGFLVPLRRVYLPGEQLKLMCNEGYVAEINVHAIGDQGSQEAKLSNAHTFECSTNGTWQLVNGSRPTSDQMSRYFETGFSNHELKNQAQCTSVSSFLAKQQEKLLKDKNLWFSSSLTYSDFNIRTLSMLFVISASIIILLVTSVATMRFYTRKHSTLRQLYSPQLSDPLLFSSDNPNFSSNTSDFRTRPQSVSRSQIQQRNCALPESPAFDSLGSTSDLNRPNAANIQNNPSSITNAYLPSYEEALLQQPVNYNQAGLFSATTSLNADSANQQPSTSSSASNKNELVINETTSIIEIAPSTLQSLGISCQGNGGRARSRSGSIRSNLTARSANGSTRTTSSIGTTNSAVSFSLLPPANRHKSSIRARRHQNFKNLSNHRGSNRGASGQMVCTPNSTQEEVVSCTSDTNTIITSTTGSSIFSGESNASVVPLRGSLSNVETTSINSSIS